MAHLTCLRLHPDQYPSQEKYPFSLDIFHNTRTIRFRSNLTFFVGENGAGKSTLLEAISHKCRFHIWRGINRTRFDASPYEDDLFKYISLEWANGSVHGSFFAADIFRNFAKNLDEWSALDPGTLDYFGGRSLMSQSHGQSLMSMFRARYKIEGLYLLDEPETALSPKSQLEFLKILKTMSSQGHAQFIVATHSPILLACPGAEILSFDASQVEPVAYEETEYYKIYKDFMEHRERYIEDLQD